MVEQCKDALPRHLVAKGGNWQILDMLHSGEVARTLDGGALSCIGATGQGHKVAKLAYTHTHTHTHMRARAHTNTNTNAPAHKHTLTQPPTRKHTHTCTCACALTHSLTHSLTQKQQAQKHAREHTSWYHSPYSNTHARTRTCFLFKPNTFSLKYVTMTTPNILYPSPSMPGLT